MAQAVLLARFSSIEESVCAAGLLEASGFHPFLADHNVSLMHWGQFYALGGRILIPEQEVEAAAELLRSVELETDNPGDMTRLVRRDRWKAWLWFIYDAGILLLVLGVIVIIQYIRRKRSIVR